MNRAEVMTRLEAIEPALRVHGVGVLYLFGSYARDDSDVDVFVDPGSDALYRFTPYMEAYETLQKAFPEAEVGYSTRDGLVRFYRLEIENEAIQVF